MAEGSVGAATRIAFHNLRNQSQVGNSSHLSRACHRHRLDPRHTIPLRRGQCNHCCNSILEAKAKVGEPLTEPPGPP